MAINNAPVCNPPPPEAIIPPDVPTATSGQDPRSLAPLPLLHQEQTEAPALQFPPLPKTTKLTALRIPNHFLLVPPFRWCDRARSNNAPPREGRTRRCGLVFPLHRWGGSMSTTPGGNAMVSHKCVHLEHSNRC